MTPMLEIRNLHKRFGNKEVLSGLNLSIPEHSIFGFVGQNGSGKTTTMKMILGLLQPDEGEIYVCGERVQFGQTATNRFIGYLPDVPEFYNFLTPTEYLTLCGESLGLNEATCRQRSEELLALVGLENDKKHRIKGFSRGMKQRLGIAQALFSQPKLLICDEPTSALDPVGRKEILSVLQSVTDKTTVLFSTHILSDVERICTDVALLHRGVIAKQGTIAELTHQKTAAFTVAGDETALRNLRTTYPLAQTNKDGKLVFTGEADLWYQVMQYIAANRLAIQSIEQSDTTLESLFMEVVTP